MKTAIAIAMIVLSGASPSSAGMLDDYNRNLQIYSDYRNAPSRVTTFGSDNFSTTTGTGVDLTTFGPDGFRITTGTVYGMDVDCYTFGSATFRTTTCR